MSRPKQPVEALIVQYFTEQPLAACESVKRIVDDVMRRRRIGMPNVLAVTPEGHQRKRKKGRTVQRSLLDAPAAREIVDDSEDDAAF